MDEKMDYDLAHYSGYGDALKPRVHPAPPAFQTEKGLTYFAKDSDGQWHYINHAGMWCACPPPVSK